MTRTELRDRLEAQMIAAWARSIDEDWGIVYEIFCELWAKYGFRREDILRSAQMNEGATK